MRLGFEKLAAAKDIHPLQESKYVTYLQLSNLDKKPSRSHGINPVEGYGIGAKGAGTAREGRRGCAQELPCFPTTD